MGSPLQKRAARLGINKRSTLKKKQGQESIDFEKKGKLFHDEDIWPPHPHLFNH